MARHTQLSKNAPRLLRIVGGKDHAGDKDHEPPPARAAANHRTNPAKVVPPSRKLHAVEVDVFAEPKSSSDEGDGQDSSELSSPPTDLQSQSPQTHQSSEPRVPRNVRGNSEREKAWSGKGDGSSVPRPRVSINTQGRPSVASTSDEDGIFGYSTGSQSKKRKRPAVYGSTNIHANHVSQRSAAPPKGHGIQRGSSAANTTKFKPPRNVRVDAASTTRTKASAFTAPLRDFNVTSSSQDEPPSFRAPLAPNGIDFSSEASAGRTRASKSLFKQPLSNGSAVLDNGMNVPQFKTRHPGSISTASSSPLSTPPDSPVHSSQAFPEDLDLVPKATCPICHKSVDPGLLFAFANGKSRMHVRKQAQFCRTHKQQDAREEWRRRRYPQIDWNKLNRRLTKHHGYLEDVLDQRIPSYYREQLDKKVRSGRERTLAQSLHVKGLEGLTPGYYGTRGAKVMMEDITAHFATKMRRLAGSDKLIASSGVSGYIQAVLVPELATLLVMEDMGVGKERAREVLAESIEIGDLVNEEEEEKGSRTGSQKELSSQGDARADGFDEIDDA